MGSTAVQASIYQLGEREDLNCNGDWIFIGTKIILRHGEEFFWDFSTRHQGRIVRSELLPKRIPTEQLLPLFSDRYNLSFCSGLETETHFVKGPSAINYSPDATRPYGIRNLMLQEAQICEVLKANPHQNIVQYHGCIRGGKWILGLCFTRYATTLRQCLEDNTVCPLRRQKYFEGIKAGVRHLHGLHLVHMDLTLDNILIDDDDQPRIIDFDACRRRGLKLGIKHGDIEEGQVTAEFKCDEVALVRIGEEINITEN